MWYRRTVDEAAYTHDCPYLLDAFDRILWQASPEEMANKAAGCRAARPNRRGIDLRPVGAALAATLLASQPQGTDASSSWMASIPDVPIMTYISWVVSLSEAWDVMSAVSDEAAETVKTLGAEARSVAEIAGIEVRSWLGVARTQVRGVIFVAALMLGAFAIWLLAVALRKF